MNGYVLGGYIVVLGSIGGYAVFLAGRLRSARRRIAASAVVSVPNEPDLA